VLDVGCANGYYMWRMVGAGAKLVVGIDPVGRSLAQFLAVRQLLAGDYPVCMLPLTLEKLPAGLPPFDTVFSMGLLYHQRDPLQHLQQLKQRLRPGGELVLETLVVAGEAQQLLVPRPRYAQMRNVYGIPSVSQLALWLAQCGDQGLGNRVFGPGVVAQLQPGKPEQVVAMGDQLLFESGCGRRHGVRAL